MSNYPPGVTGFEPEIAGYDERDVVLDEFYCRTCEVEQVQVDAVVMQATAYTTVTVTVCPLCGATTETETEIEDDRDPDEGRGEEW